ncbi:hypothetical protein JCGZ_03890 [Jatropha curcas]|uniref:Uncharacterized protein n=1 Tax=Jatropha curcas TaxID=180498 RepID=A0A067LFB4_JATCU|nr:hypothetical protein JCGZ_03890 [Jatropha curcas]
MDLCIRGAHLKVSYKWAIEVCEYKVLPMSGLFGFEGRVNARTPPRGRAWWYNWRYSHTTSDIGMFRQLLNGFSWDRLPFINIDVSSFQVCSTISITSKRRSPSSLYVQRLCRICMDSAPDSCPPPTEFDPIIEAEELNRGQGATPKQQRDKRVRGGSEPRASDTTVVVGTPENWPVPHSPYSGPHRSAYPGHARDASCEPYRMSPPYCTHRVDIAPPAGRGQGIRCGGHAGSEAGCQPMIMEEIQESGSEDSEETTQTYWTLASAFEALFCSLSREDWDSLSLFEVNMLSYYRNIRVKLGLLQWLINHFDPSNNLFCHNDFEIYLLFEELSIISRRIPVVDEIPAVPRLDLDPAGGLDWTLASAFEALFCSLSREDWDSLSLFEVNMLSYYRNIRVKLGLLQWLINHFDPSNNLFCHNDFEIYLLFEELSIISRRIPVVDEIPAVPRLDLDPAGGLAYEISSYDFGAYVVHLQPLVDRALGVDQRVRVSSYMLYEPLCGFSMAHAYYPSRVARQYGRHKAVLDYTRFEGGLITK